MRIAPGQLSRPVIAVCGVKNSGKTTLLCALTRYLSAQGLKVAVIKHDGHDFACDVEGTDSHAVMDAGAYGTAVFSDWRIFVHKTGTGEDEHFLTSLFPEADLIFVEGLKDRPYPKIEVIRQGISDTPVSNPEGRFLIVTDFPEGTFDEPQLAFGEIEAIAKLVVEMSVQMSV